MGDTYRGSYRRSPPPHDRIPYRRDRDEHPDVEYFGQGESYRPGGVGEGPARPVPRDARERGPADSWGGDRRDDRRREEIDSYIPATSARAQRPRSRSPTYRRRSRSPGARGKELFPDRERSPRRYSPRRDDRPRSPMRRRSRSPGVGRGRSPDNTRSRDYTPDSRRSPRRGYSPPRPRFDRPRSPPRRGHSPPRDVDRGGFRPRSRTPERRPAYNDGNRRRRSPSLRASGPGSAATSRKSSPPVHPDRASLAGSVPRSPTYASRSYGTKEPRNYRARSPRRDYPSREPTPPPTDYEMADTSAAAPAPPTGPSEYRNGSYERPPPTGPSRSYGRPAQLSPSAVPANSPTVQNRVGPPPVPTGPRNASIGRPDNPSREFSSSPVRGRGSLTYRAPGARSANFNDGPLAGPRGASYGGAPRGEFGGGRGRGAYGGGAGLGGGVGSGTGGYGRGDQQHYSADFRSSNNSTSTTYPRTQRFTNTTTPVNTAQAHMSTLEKVVPGGKKLPSGLPPDQERRMRQLEEEAERMREVIKERQKTKREALSEWDTRQRESEREALRSELAEGALAKLNEDENGSSGAAF